MQPTSTAPNTHLYGLLLMVLAITLMGQFGHQLWTPDEPREAAIAWEMFTSRELAIPTLGASSFIEKPPLYYILTIPFLALLHDNLGVTVALRLVGLCGPWQPCCSPACWPDGYWAPALPPSGR